MKTFAQLWRRHIPTITQEPHQAEELLEMLLENHNAPNRKAFNEAHLNRMAKALFLEQEETTPDFQAIRLLLCIGFHRSKYTATMPHYAFQSSQSIVFAIDTLTPRIKPLFAPFILHVTQALSCAGLNQQMPDNAAIESFLEADLTLFSEKPEIYQKFIFNLEAELVDVGQHNSKVFLMARHRLLIQLHAKNKEGALFTLPEFRHHQAQAIQNVSAELVQISQRLGSA